MRCLGMMGLMLYFSLAAAAQDGAGSCRADIENYCSASKGNPKQAKDCLLEHQQEISDGCYEKLKRQKEKREATKACRQDVVQFCKDVEPGGGRIVGCLKDHQKEISDACYDALARNKAGTPAPQ